MNTKESVDFDVEGNGEQQPANQTPKEENQEGTWYDQFLEDYDYTLPKRGQLLEGQILRIDEDAVIVDVGVKRDAIIPSRDLNMVDKEIVENLKVGDTILVYVLRPPTGDDDLLVSLNKGIEHTHWEVAEQHLESGETLELEVVGENRGGLLVEYKSLRGFVPNSQVPELRRRDRQKAKEAKREMIGEVLPLKVIEVNRDRHRLILSALAAQEERRKKRLHELEKDQVIFGRVVNIVNFGVFVDLGGIDGLVHISELDWQRVGHPSEMFKVGDEIQVQVIEVDVERERVSLSRKSLLPSPWDTLAEKYKPGDLIEGTVTKVLDFGAFVELPEGVEGLVHVSEIGYSTTGTPQEVVKAGEEVLVRILDIDKERERISLSMRKVPLEKQIAWMVEQEEKQSAAREEAAQAAEQEAEEPQPEAPEAEITEEVPAAETRVEEGALEAEALEAEALEAEASQAESLETEAPEAEAPAELPAIEESEEAEAPVAPSAELPTAEESPEAEAPAAELPEEEEAPAAETPAEEDVPEDVEESDRLQDTGEANS